MSLQFVVAISRKSITNDETAHIPAGYYHLVAEDFQLNTEHPPLVKMWAALPLLFIQPKEPIITEKTDADFAQRSAMVEQQFWFANQTQFLRIGFWTRLMMIPLAVLLGVVIFIFTRTISNSTAALIAVFMYSIEPTILAHGRVVHTDLAAALGYLLFFFALFQYHRFPTHRKAILLGVVTALALLTKYSMVILVPLLALYALALAWSYRRDSIRLKKLMIHAVAVTGIVILMINAVYFFRHDQMSDPDRGWLLSTSQPYSNAIYQGITVLGHVIPTYYLFGVYKVAIHNHYGHPAFLLGKYSNDGWRYYFPVAFALKTTIPFLLLSVVALAWGIFQIVARRRITLLWLLIPFLIYLGISVSGSINIGIRHFLPAFPFLFILGGMFLTEVIKSRQRTLGIALTVLLIGLMCVEAVRVFPNYTPYMNQLAAGPNWRYLSDSNVEWGDDVNSLAAYLKSRGETRVRAALSGGWITLPLYGIDYIGMAPPVKELVDTRYVAIGASFLNGSTVPSFEVNGKLISDSERVNLFETYRHRTPEAVFGGSIYLFRER
ncbi:MAG TPA: glycosyltransferase family 39 protein [Pyrinomonadaceae bacterium]|nr:glycosyltransferase family 39 protein [Pyrinomonadaceae bacterium]